MMQEWKNDATFKGLVAMVLVLAGVGLAMYSYLAYTEAKYIGGEISSISVSGKSETFVRPDIANFTFSVLADEETATAAQEKSAVAINEISAYLKEKGVEEKDIKTVDYNLQPKYEYINELCVQGRPCTPGRQNLVGYTVSQTISVKVRKMEDAGALISGVGDKGATNISGISFTIDDTDAARAQVREEAIADAQVKAERLADSLGVRLGRLMSYSEDGQMPVPYAGYGGVMMEKAMDGMATAPQVTPGENEITSNVTLVYEIR